MNNALHALALLGLAVIPIAGPWRALRTWSPNWIPLPVFFLLGSQSLLALFLLDRWHPVLGHRPLSITLLLILANTTWFALWTAQLLWHIPAPTRRGSDQPSAPPSASLQALYTLMGIPPDDPFPLQRLYDTTIRLHREHAEFLGALRRIALATHFQGTECRLCQAVGSTDLPEGFPHTPRCPLYPYSFQGSRPTQVASRDETDPRRFPARRIL